MSRQMCTLFVDELYLGVEIGRVQEVIRDPQITPVPGSPAAISGLTNLRGQIVTAVSLRTIFGLPEQPPGSATTMLILADGGEPVGLLVDTAGEVVEVDDCQWEDPPEMLRGESRRLVRGAYKLARRLLLVLDVGQALVIDGCAAGPCTGPPTAPR